MIYLFISIEKLKPAGPSPMTAGLMLALALVRGGGKKF